MSWARTVAPLGGAALARRGRLDPEVLHLVTSLKLLTHLDKLVGWV